MVYSSTIDSEVGTIYSITGNSGTSATNVVNSTNPNITAIDITTAPVFRPSTVGSTDMPTVSFTPSSMATENSTSVSLTLPPATTSLAGSQASTSVSSISSKIENLSTLIKSWKAGPISSKSEILGEIKAVKSDLEYLISDLGGESSSSGCGKGTTVLDKLSCIDTDLDKVTISINDDDNGSIDSELDD
ncbi:hypothetical protein MBLNU459_g4780t1 [Dothideomycetes sp. NU459]